MCALSFQGRRGARTKSARVLTTRQQSLFICFTVRWISELPFINYDSNKTRIEITGEYHGWVRQQPSQSSKCDAIKYVAGQGEWRGRRIQESTEPPFFLGGKSCRVIIGRVQSPAPKVPEETCTGTVYKDNIYEVTAARYRFKELRFRASSSSGRLANAVAAWA